MSIIGDESFEHPSRLQRDLTAARAERDELNRQLSVALKGKRPYSSKFADETIASQVRRIAELEEKLNGWFSERNAARAERDEHIARNNDSLLALHLATAERDRAVACLKDAGWTLIDGAERWKPPVNERMGELNQRVFALTDERDALRADVARLREVLKRIVSNGGNATNVMLFDARTALAQ